MEKLIPLTPQQYFDKIQSLHTPEEIQVLCEALTAALFNDTDKPKTRVNKLTPYNKLIRTIPDDVLIENENAYIQTKEDGTLWKRHLHFRYTGLETINFNKEGGINAGNNKINRLENCLKIDVSAYLETTIKLLESNDFYELAVGLIAASGRRPIEILARGYFTEINKLPKYLKAGYFLEFQGQAKKRDYNLPEDERPEYRIGVLVPANMFLELWERFDNMPESEEIRKFLEEETKKGTSQEDINKKIENKCGKALRDIIQQKFHFLPPRHGHKNINNISLRAAYLRLITERDCPKNIHDLLWAARAAGHFIDTAKPDDSQLKQLVTTIGYCDYYVDETVPFVDFEEKAIEPEVVPDLKPELIQDIKPELIQDTKSTKARKELSQPWRGYQSDIEKLKKIQDEQNLNNQQDAIRYLFQQVETVSNLEKQVSDLQSELAKLEESKAEVMYQPNVKESDDVFEERIEKVLRKLLPQLQHSQVESIKSEDKQEVEKTKPEKPQRDWDTVPSEELKLTKVRGAKIQKIERSWLAIENYNNEATEKNQKWYVGLRTISELSGCNGQDVSPWIAEHKLMIDDHNSKHQLGVHHNKAHKDTKISDVIKW